MKSQGFNRNRTHEFAMQEAIMTAQLEAERAALSRADSSSKVILLSDRSAVDPAVYAETSGARPSQDRARLLDTEGFQNALNFYRESLFGKPKSHSGRWEGLMKLHPVVLQPVVDWLEDDGVRSLEDPWNYNNHLCSTLRELSIPFIEIDESVRDLSERVKLVEAHLLTS